MKKHVLLSVLFFFIHLLFYSTAGAQSTTFYGITKRLLPSKVLYFSEVNLATGMVNNVTNTTVGLHSDGTDATIDPVNQKYYYHPTGQFSGIDIASGLVHTAPGLNDAFMSFHFNPNDSLIYGTHAVITPNLAIYIAAIDPQTGVVKDISPSLAAFATAAGLALDTKKNIFYQKLSPTIITPFDLNTNSVLPSIQTSLDIQNIVFNCADSSIYGTYNPGNTGYWLARLNVQTGVVTIVSAAAFAPYVSSAMFMNGGYLIDQCAGVYYWNSSNAITGVDVTTGNVVSNTTLTISNGDHFIHMAKYPNCFCLENTTGLNGTLNEDAPGINVFPNPTSSFITLSNFNPAHSYSISIKNILGNTIISQTTKGKERASINFAILPSGIYFVTVESDGKVETKKIVKL